jgi:septal ring factor EnvC (AmiA/AmiB activator)
MEDRQSLSSMDIVAALTRVVQEQDRELAELKQRLAAQDELLARQASEREAVQTALADVLTRLARLEDERGNPRD